METKPKHLAKGLLLLVPAVWVMLVLIVLNFTSPISSGPPGVLAVLVLLYLLIASLTYLLLRAFSYVSARLSKSVMPKRHSLYIAAVLALGPIFLVALNTLGSVGLPELVLVTLLVVSGCFYVSRRVMVD
jgi:hypothetical protein